MQASIHSRPLAGSSVNSLPSDLQLSGLDLPVPRWSTSTMPRSFMMSLNPGASPGKVATAACPGPPARKNTGSAAGSLVLRGGIQAMLSATVRPPCLLRSSGTAKVVHCASSGSPCGNGDGSEHGLNCRLPRVRSLLASDCGAAAFCVQPAASVAATASDSMRGRVFMVNLLRDACISPRG